MAEIGEQRDFREIVSEETSLTLGDRVNYPYLLAQMILNFQKAIVKDEYVQSFQEIQEAAQGLYEMIPTAWRIADKSFDKEINESYIFIPVDQRQYWCGVPIGIPNIKIIKVCNPYKMFNACINLLQRRGLLSRTLYSEVKTGNEYLEGDKDLEEALVEDETEVVDDL